MRLFIKRIRSYFPTLFPVGLPAFHEWADSIIELSGHYADESSMKFALASMLIHYKSTAGAAPKAFFVKCLRKSAANQVASQVFQDIKVTQEKKQVEDTTPTSEVSNDTPQTN